MNMNGHTPRGRGPWLVLAAIVALLPTLLLGLRIRQTIADWRDPYFDERMRITAQHENEREWIATERLRIRQAAEYDRYVWWHDAWQRWTPTALVAGQGLIALAALGVGGLLLAVCAGPALVCWRRARLVWPDAAGNLPVPRILLERGQLLDLAGQLLLELRHVEGLAAQRGGTPHTLTFEYRNAQSATGAQLPAPAAALPAPAFESLARQGLIGGDQLVFGADAESGDLVTGTWLDLYSSGVGGLSGTGKTWTAASLLSQSALAGARLAILDPHAANSESLTARMAPLAAAYLCKPAQTLAEQDATIALVLGELERRKAAQQAGPPWVVACDEFTSLMRSSIAGDLAGLFEEIAQEGRKLGIYGLALGQTWTATRAGGTELRDSLASAFIHRLRPAQARYLTGLTADSLPSDLLDLPAGVCYWLSTAGELRKLAIPRMSPRDIDAVAAMLRGRTKSSADAPAGTMPAADRPLRAFGFAASRVKAGEVGGEVGGEVAGEVGGEVAGEVGDTASQCAESGMTAEEALIVAEYRAGKTLTEIARALASGATGGKAYQDAARRVNAAIRKALCATIAG